jgi:2-polyprenyl-3-methyl-5-hydroxy-6-metoxy-1,4-benzoquinol methylase
VSLGRRKAGLEDPERWVFNRMADVYDARPPYPAALIDALAALAGPPGSRIADLGAGIGHLALPLAARGYDVTAVEPAGEMLARLRATAEARGLAVETTHATAEMLPAPARPFDLVVVADALHFMDAQLLGEALARLLRHQGALAVVTCALGETPFMEQLLSVIGDAVPRRPRSVARQLAQVTSIARTPLGEEQRFDDETPVDHAQLERILRSISFVGPAMNAQRFEAFRARVRALPASPAWARQFTLRAGRRVVRRQPTRLAPSRAR